MKQSLDEKMPPAWFIALTSLHASRRGYSLAGHVMPHASDAMEAVQIQTANETPCRRPVQDGNCKAQLPREYCQKGYGSA